MVLLIVNWNTAGFLSSEILHILPVQNQQTIDRGFCVFLLVWAETDHLKVKSGKIREKCKYNSRGRVANFWWNTQTVRS